MVTSREKISIPFLETGKTQIPASSNIPLRFKYIAFASVFVVFNLLYISFPGPFAENALTLKTGEASKSFEDVCIKPKFDYFDPEIMKFYAILPQPVCNYTENAATRVLKGKLLNLQPDIYDCWGRCQAFKSSNETLEGEWINTAFNHTFDCDIVEARCAPIGGHILEPNHMFLHTQIVEQPAETSKFNVIGKQYDIYFITVDLSHTPKCLGVIFPYLNRVGASSRGNGFAWYFGKVNDLVERDVFFMPSIQPEPEWMPQASCGRKLNNETMIISEFRDYGHMTLDAADQWRTIDYGCEGADTPYSHHTYSPYFLTLLKKTQLPNYIHGSHYCRTHHERAINYLNKFVASYQDKPKMGHLWLSYVGHDSEVGSIEADAPLVEFFKMHRDTLDNSFIIFGGDHGFRQSDALKTKVGAIDVNNPALIMTVPKELRKNSELMETLRENSGELQTHFDTRATLLDILKYQPSTNYSDQTTMNIDGEFGHSFLRRQPKPPTCRTLPIPPFFCICEKSMRKDIMKENPSRAELIGKVAIDSINQRLIKEEAQDKCRKWTFVRVYLAGKDDGSVGVFNHDTIDHYGDNGNCMTKRILQSSCDCL